MASDHTVKKDNVVKLFDTLQPAAMPLDTAHITRRSDVGGRAAADRKFFSLADRRKLIVTLGEGNVGKTTFWRWQAEKELEASRDIILASVHGSPALRRYFPDVLVPDGDTVRWLENLLRHQMEHHVTVGIDFGGGDMSWSEMLRRTPDVVGILAARDIETVVIYPLSARVTDLTVAAGMEELGFKPKATVLLLNEGKIDTAQSIDQGFGATRRQPVYQALLARGAAEIVMPRLYDAGVVEQYSDSFVALGERDVFLGHNLATWNMRMTEAFAPVASWIEA